MRNIYHAVKNLSGHIFFEESFDWKSLEKVFPLIFDEIAEKGKQTQDLSRRYCQALDAEIDAAHDYFLYISEMKLAIASLGMAVASGIRLQATREILDMADTLYQNITDPDSTLPDNQRKQLNHAEEVWLDMKAKKIKFKSDLDKTVLSEIIKKRK